MKMWENSQIVMKVKSVKGVLLSALVMWVLGLSSAGDPLRKHIEYACQNGPSEG